MDTALAEKKDSENKTFSNARAQVSLNIQPECQVNAHVTLLPATVKSIRDQAIKTVGKEVTLPGFRKGKVPATMVESQFSNEIERKWDQMLRNEALVETLVQSGLKIMQERPTLSSRVKNKDLEKGAELELDFQVNPDLPELDLTDIKPLDKKAEPITDADVEEMLDNIRLYFADWKEVQDRSIKEGDFVIVDVFDAAQTPQAPLFTDQQFKVSEKAMAGWMYKHIIGKKPGESFRAFSELDKDANEEQKKRFEPTDCCVEIKAIKTAVLPEIDDALAQKVGAKSADELKTNAKNMVEGQAAERLLNEQRGHLVDALLDKYTFDVPKSLVEDQVPSLFEHLQRGIYSNKALDRSVFGSAREELKEKAREQAQRLIRLSYIVKRVADEEKVRPTDQEVMQHLLRSMPMEAIQQLSDPKHAEQKQAAIGRATLELVELKVLDHLLEKIGKK
jgi:trigger factor